MGRISDLRARRRCAAVKRFALLLAVAAVFWGAAFLAGCSRAPQKKRDDPATITYQIPVIKADGSVQQLDLGGRAQRYFMPAAAPAAPEI